MGVPVGPCVRLVRTRAGKEMVAWHPALDRAGRRTRQPRGPAASSRVGWCSRRRRPAAPRPPGCPRPHSEARPALARHGDRRDGGG
jgi:hypothetical protein